MQRLIFFLIFISVFSSPAKARQDIPLKIFRMIYMQDYDSAHFVLKQHAEKLDPFYAVVLQIDLAYWESVTGTETPDYDAFDEVLLKNTPSQTSSQNDKIKSLIVLSYRLRAEFKRYRFISAFQTRSQSLKLYNELKNSGISPPEAQKEVFELYNALIVYFNQFPAKYYSGSSRNRAQNALVEMEILTNSGSEIVKTLSAYFLGKIYLEYENEPEKAIALFAYLTEEYPKNKKFPEYLKEAKTKANH